MKSFSRTVIASGASIAAKPKRKYRLTPQGARSEKAAAARRANLERARAAPKEVIYRPTEKRWAASRANIQKAITARKTPRGADAARLNALIHGVFARNVAASVRRLGENPRQYRNHHKLFQRIFLPQDEQETVWVRRMADISWKRLRFFRAQAVWELARLKKAFRGAGATRKLDAQETEYRAHVLSDVLYNYQHYFRLTLKFQSQIERLLRLLLKKRSGGKIIFKLLAPLRLAREEWVDLPFDELMTRLRKLAPQFAPSWQRGE